MNFFMKLGTLLLSLGIFLGSATSFASSIEAKCSVKGKYESIDFDISVSLKDGVGNVVLKATAPDGEKIEESEEMSAPFYSFFLKSDQEMYDAIIQVVSGKHSGTEFSIEPLTTAEIHKVEGIEIQSQLGEIKSPSDDFGDYAMIQLLALDRSVVARFILTAEQVAIGRCK